MTRNALLLVCLAPVWPPAPGPSSWFNTREGGGGALFAEAEALAAVMATRRTTKPARMGCRVTQRSVYSHSGTQLVRFIAHTLAWIRTCLRWHPQAHAGRLCQAYKWPHGHIPTNLQSPYFQSASLPPREPCHQSSCKMSASRGRNLGGTSRKTSSTLY